jgi:hypothetical protein
VTSVRAELQYLDSRSTVLRRFTAPGASISTGSNQSHTVPIRDGQPIQGAFSTDNQGFEILLLAGVQSAAPGLAAGALRLSQPPRREGVPNQLYFVDSIPDDPLAGVDESKMITSGSEFVFSLDQEWWYFPDTARDEILFFLFHDSDHSHAWRVLHPAFGDPTVADAVPRHSIEVRSFACLSGVSRSTPAPSSLTVETLK